MTAWLPYAITTRFNEGRHNHVCRPILETVPIVPADDGVILFSMIGTRVVLPYLVAVKSLWHQLRRGRVVLLDDGTLSNADRSVLTLHLGAPQICTFADVARPDYPAGGCWERLAGMLALRRDAFVIQLDSDTVTIGAVPEIAEAIAAGRSFTLAGDARGAQAGRMNGRDYAARYYANGRDNDHVQSVLEEALGDLPGGDTLNYIRGCAGFAGLARAADGDGEAAALVAGFQHHVGAGRMAQWGSEQFLSNLIVANEPDPVILPYARYCNYWGQPWNDDMRFVHFVGTHRYANDAYARATRSALNILRG